MIVCYQAALKQERERSATSALTSSKHTELLRKLETLNALTDSNRVLREERCAFISRAEELSAKVVQLEAELAPLRESSREFNTKIDELGAENQTLRKQVVAWKARTNTLQVRFLLSSKMTFCSPFFMGLANFLRNFPK